MKKFLLLVIASCCVFQGFSQSEKTIKGKSFGIHVILNDYGLAKYIRQNGLSEAVNNKQLFNGSNMNGGIGLSYMKGVTPLLDFSTMLSASFNELKTVTYQPTTPIFLELAAAGHLKLLSDDHFFTPYLTAGVGASMYGSHFGAFIPVGIGMQFKLTDDAFVQINNQYRIKVTDNTDYHLFHSLGFVKSFGSGKVVAPVVPVPVVTDRDNDGVLDVEDLCPDEAGTAALHGCPDKDGDGIADAADKCPDVAGIAKYEGCPIPDADKDGVNDEEDKCPTVAGVARYQGCPIPDTDGDGVNDEEDKCKDRPGPVSNQGCPEIAKEVIEKVQFAAKNVYFSTGSYKLLSKSNKSLNEVAKILKDDTSLMLDVDGHTDAQGGDAMNQTLSENRAKAVVDYLVKQGVDASRLKSTGYGETKPVADNNTAAGRAKNRRTEMTVRNY